MFTQVRALSMEVKPYVLLLFILMKYQGTELIYLEIICCGLNPRSLACMTMVMSISHPDYALQFI